MAYQEEMFWTLSWAVFLFCAHSISTHTTSHHTTPHHTTIPSFLPLSMMDIFDVKRAGWLAGWLAWVQTSRAGGQATWLVLAFRGWCLLLRPAPSRWAGLSVGAIP